jgi:predicted enzyme related to lactoylglutathione lyase
MFANTEAFSSFAVDDLAKARQFYSETLGLQVSDVQMEGLIALNVSGSRDIMVYEKPDHIPAVFTILNFPVEDVEKAVDDLTARGVRFERYEDFNMDEKNIARGEGPAIAWFTDPAGNILAVMQQS